MKIIVDSVRWREFMMGITLGMLFLLPWSSFFGSAPYTNVEVTQVEVIGTEVLVTSNFTKSECTFKRLEVFGTDFGETYNLGWSNQPVPGEADKGTTYDRAVGHQTLRISVETGGRAFDTIEIRTRHDCSGSTVDKVFTTINLNK